jgi:hypothetical protein
MLSRGGYFTAMTGKWHLQRESTDFGFDRYFGHLMLHFTPCLKTMQNTKVDMIKAGTSSGQPAWQSRSKSDCCHRIWQKALVQNTFLRGSRWSRGDRSTKQIE